MPHVAPGAAITIGSSHTLRKSHNKVVEIGKFSAIAKAYRRKPNQPRSLGMAQLESRR